MLDITHPLDLNTVVTANTPPCSCKGPNAPVEVVTSTVLKVIQNHSGVWYFLKCGKTVKSSWITSVDTLP